MTLVVNNITFERNYQLILNKVNAVIHPGSILQIQGANGSGKSTLLRILAGLIEPDTGEVMWNATSIFKQREEYQEKLHYIGHLNGIKSNLTVMENINLMMALLKKKIANEQVQQVLHDFKLLHLANTQVSYLSAGQQRRVGLSRLVLCPKPLWILDEPNAALDREGQEILSTLLVKHARNNGIAVVATHQALIIHASAVFSQVPAISTLQLGEQNA